MKLMKYVKDPVIACYPDGRVRWFRNGLDCRKTLGIGYQRMKKMLNTGEAYDTANSRTNKRLEGMTLDYATTSDESFYAEK